MNTAGSYTPGPWRVAPNTEYTSGINVDAGQRGYVCLVGQPGDEAAAANARLISEAPSMLAMLQKVADFKFSEIEGREGYLAALTAFVSLKHEVRRVILEATT